jgi:hypothetical protein
VIGRKYGARERQYKKQAVRPERCGSSGSGGNNKQSQSTCVMCRGLLKDGLQAGTFEFQVTLFFLLLSHAEVGTHVQTNPLH